MQASQKLSAQLKLSFPYDWSNRHIDENAFILLVVEGCYIEDVVKCAKHFGIQRIIKALPDIDDPLTFKIAERQIDNIKAAFNASV